MKRRDGGQVFISVEATYFRGSDSFQQKPFVFAWDYNSESYSSEWKTFILVEDPFNGVIRFNGNNFF